ncbi:MAG: N-acetylglucosamine-6-phosphate deacetylase [Chromatiaceae bacterium]|jgi:N-acetylglucosamine-6-phosphate deacetylase
MKLTLIADQLFDGEQLYEQRPLSIEDGYIRTLDTVRGATEIRIKGMLAPGFIDCQVNGGGGLLFNQAPSEQTLKRMMQAHARYGTTSMLPTVISSDYELALHAAAAVSQALTLGIPGIIGVHFEGPHLASEKRGIHNNQVLRPLADHELALYRRKDLGTVLLTVAPETVSPEQISDLVRKKVLVSLGHSNATSLQTQAALDAGATGFTHLFNAMSPLTSREPGMVGIALTDQQSWCGLIADGHHVHPLSAQLALKLKPRGKIMLVTDAMWTPDAHQQEFSFENHSISLHNKRLQNKSGQLAGAAISMLDAVNYTISALGIDTLEALRMASLYPAQFLGRSTEIGQLKPGTRADLVQLSSSLDGTFTIQNTWLRGRSLLSTQETSYEQN